MQILSSNFLHFAKDDRILLVYFVAKGKGDNVFSIVLLCLESATTSSSGRAVLKMSVVVKLF